MSTVSCQKLAYEYAAAYGQLSGALPLHCLEASREGDPEGGFFVDGRFYTMSFLTYYLRYVYVHKRIDLTACDTVLELGSGAGIQAEVLHKAHPHLSIVLVDRAPQLYICEQYLKAIFPSDVEGFEATRLCAPEVKPGKIYIVGLAGWPVVTGRYYDLFWNAASFQEMTQDAARYYLSGLCGKVQRLYLLESMEGHRGGGAEPVTMDFYRDALPTYALRDLDPLIEPPYIQTSYHHSIWELI